MVESRPGAAPGGRKQWDKAEWEAKAKAKDEENVERAKAAEDAMKHGKRPPKFQPKDDLPKPTKLLEARTEDLEIEKNLNKTMLVQTTTTGKGPRGPGFFCELCNRTLKDSLSYLDHVNSRSHLRQLGQTTQVARSTVSQVRARIAQLRAATAQKVTAKNFDFRKRLEDVRAQDDEARGRRREERKRKREERREEEALGRIGVIGKKLKVEEDARNGKRDRKMEKKTQEEEKEVERAQQEHDEMAAMMGFGGFGGKKR